MTGKSGQCHKICDLAFMRAQAAREDILAGLAFERRMRYT